MYNPYESNESLHFNLKTYAAYLKENNINVNHITDAVFQYLRNLSLNIAECLSWYNDQ